MLARDGALCTFVATDGQRCQERGWLELHHEQPFGRGGPSTVNNIRVLCRSHNQLLAERDYGPIFVQRRIARARRERKRSELVPGPMPGAS